MAILKPILVATALLGFAQSQSNTTICRSDIHYNVGDYNQSLTQMTNWVQLGYQINVGAWHQEHSGAAQVYICNHLDGPVTIDTTEFSSAMTVLEDMCGEGVAGSFLGLDSDNNGQVSYVRDVYPNSECGF